MPKFVFLKSAAWHSKTLAVIVPHSVKTWFLPKWLLQNNTSLMPMKIVFCEDLMSLSAHQNVWAFETSLQSFPIFNGKKLNYYWWPQYSVLTKKGRFHYPLFPVFPPPPPPSIFTQLLHSTGKENFGNPFFFFLWNHFGIIHVGMSCHSSGAALHDLIVMVS